MSVTPATELAVLQRRLRRVCHETGTVNLGFLCPGNQRLHHAWAEKHSGSSPLILGSEENPRTLHAQWCGLSKAALFCFLLVFCDLLPPQTPMKGSTCISNRSFFFFFLKYFRVNHWGKVRGVNFPDSSISFIEVHSALASAVIY